MAIEEPGELLILVCNSSANNVDGEDVILLNLSRVINKKKNLTESNGSLVETAVQEEIWPHMVAVLV